MRPRYRNGDYSAFWFSPAIGTFIGFHQLFSTAEPPLFSTADPQLFSTAEQQLFSTAEQQLSSWWIYCEERLWRTSFALLDLGIQEFRFGPRFANFNEWISYPPKSFSEVWLVSPCTKQQWQLYFFSFHHTTDKVQGACCSRAKPQQYWFLPLHSVGTSSVVFSLLSKTRMDSSSSFLLCSKLTRCNPETCKLRDQLRFREIFISTS